MFLIFVNFHVRVNLFNVALVSGTNPAVPAGYMTADSCECLQQTISSAERTFCSMVELPITLYTGVFITQFSDP
jgi:hypothetical protein